jgi:hypothetical protein
LESANGGRRSNCCRHHQNQCSRRVLKMLGKSFVTQLSLPTPVQIG